MKEVLDFLAELAVNNNREWFAEHKDWYQRAYAKFVDFSEQYIRRLSEIDPALAIYRFPDIQSRKVSGNRDLQNE